VPEKYERTVKQPVKVKLYSIVSDQVERGIEIGLRRAFKHSEETLKDEAHERIKDAVHAEIMLALDEVIDFGPTEQ